MSLKYASIGVETPEFSSFTKRKDKKMSNDSTAQKTHKKKDSYHSHTSSKNMSVQDLHELESMKKDYDNIVKRLQKT